MKKTYDVYEQLIYKRDLRDHKKIRNDLETVNIKEMQFKIKQHNFTPNSLEKIFKIVRYYVSAGV